MTLDLFVGFEKKPEDLEGFLKKEGYTHVARDSDGTLCFERAHATWPQVFYFSKPLIVEEDDEETVPNWQKSPFAIVSEVDINFPHSDFSIGEEADRLSKELVKRLNGILYDPDMDEYFTRKDF